MTDKERAILAVKALKEKYPDSLCSLNAENPLQLLIATRLSAQCTDARVNLVTPALFEKYRNVEDFAKADIGDVEKLVHSCGFYRAKAKDIVEMSKKIISDFGGEVPDNLDDLTSLPGVGRKTANLIMGDVYGQPAVVALVTENGLNPAGSADRDKAITLQPSTMASDNAFFNSSILSISTIRGCSIVSVISWAQVV